MGCFEKGLKQSSRGVKQHPFFISFLEKVAKRWPKLGYKRKKILLFRSFWTTCKISLVPGTGLEPALLSKYAPETYASTNSAIRAFDGQETYLLPRPINRMDYHVNLWFSGLQSAFLMCPGQDLNLHRLRRLPPQSSVSTNSTTWASALLLRQCFWFSKAVAKVVIFCGLTKYFFQCIV